MIHRIAAGFFDSNAIVTYRRVHVTQPLNSDIVVKLLDEFNLKYSSGDIEIDDDDFVNMRNGFVDCPWLSIGVNQKAVRFLLRLHEETGCMFADVAHGEIIKPDELKASIAV